MNVTENGLSDREGGTGTEDCLKSENHCQKADMQLEREAIKIALTTSFSLHVIFMQILEKSTGVSEVSVEGYTLDEPKTQICSSGMVLSNSQQSQSRQAVVFCSVNPLPSLHPQIFYFFLFFLLITVRASMMS